MTLSDTIAELRKLEAEATKEPWSTYDPGQLSGYVAVNSGPPFHDTPAECAGDNPYHDAALIVAMRNALPRILERMEKLERVAEAATKLHAECPYEVDHSGRCDRNTDNRATKPCECGTNDWVEADEALGGALAALDDET